MVLAAALITAFLVARFGDLPLPGGGSFLLGDENLTARDRVRLEALLGPPAASAP